jgi:hypothetical protein
MTQSGICHNACFSDTTLTRALAFDLQPAWARTIVIPGSEQAVIDAARDVAVAGVKTEVVYTTQSAACAVDNLNAYTAALDRFLSQANGAVQAIGIMNELDTPGWTDSHGSPITDALIIAVAAAGAAVCRRHGVLAIAPSFLGGPAEGRFEHVAAGLVGVVDAMAVHPYFRSIGGFPRAGWIYGTVEDAAEDCRRLSSGLPVWFDEAGCPTIYDSVGQQGQADYTTALRAFQHPSIPVICQFALHDGVGGPDEIAQGKDWGLIATGGARKEAYHAYAEGPGGVPVPVPVPTPAPDPEPEPVLAAADASLLDLWQAIRSDIDYAPDTAIAKLWASDPYRFGPPLGPERYDRDDQGNAVLVMQSFGYARLRWRAGQGEAEVA